MLAYRFMWEMTFGEIPPGIFVCHKCDNPLCVNPDHLFLGDHQDNMTDMVQKSRQTSGEKNARAFLTEGEVLAIRADRKAGDTYNAIAQRYGIAMMTAYYICIGRRWKHLPL